MNHQNSWDELMMDQLMKHGVTPQTEHTIRHELAAKQFPLVNGNHQLLRL